MKSQKYQFTQLENGKQKPKIPVNVINHSTGQKLRVFALLDTGADSCTFPSMITRTIGYRLDAKSKCEKGTRGISGIEIDTYAHGFRIEVLDQSRKNVIRIIDLVGHTIENNDLPPILGTHNFLELFRIDFDYINNEFELKW